jgi:hypothetical protein
MCLPLLHALFGTLSYQMDHMCVFICSFWQLVNWAVLFKIAMGFMLSHWTFLVNVASSHIVGTQCVCSLMAYILPPSFVNIVKSWKVSNFASWQFSFHPMPLYYFHVVFTICHVTLLTTTYANIMDVGIL